MFAQECGQTFERRLQAHLRAFFPRYCASLGAATLAAVVAYGRSRAGAHGLSAKRDVGVYVTLVPLLGSHFDVDPLLPWAGAALSDARLRNPSARAERLAEEAMSYLDVLVGHDDSRFGQVLVRAHDVVRRLLASRPHTLGADDLDAMRLLFPEKHAAVGDGPCASLVSIARDEAERWGLRSAWARQALTLVMFALGPRFLDDPQFGWASRALRGASGDADDGVAALVAAASRELQSWGVESGSRDA